MVTVIIVLVTVIIVVVVIVSAMVILNFDIVAVIIVIGIIVIVAIAVIVKPNENRHQIKMGLLCPVGHNSNHFPSEGHTRGPEYENGDNHDKKKQWWSQ